MDNDDQNTQVQPNQVTSDQNLENQAVSANQPSSFNPSGVPTQYADSGALVTAGSNEGKKGNKKVIVHK